MASRNYVKGRNFEYRVIAYLRKLGYYCFRAYGSKGLYDVGAFALTEKITNNELSPFFGSLLIQCKSNGYVPPNELKKLKNNSKWNATHLIAYKENHKLKFRSLNGEEIIIA